MLIHMTVCAGAPQTGIFSTALQKEDSYGNDT